MIMLVFMKIIGWFSFRLCKALFKFSPIVEDGKSSQLSQNKQQLKKNLRNYTPQRIMHFKFITSLQIQKSKF